MSTPPYYPPGWNKERWQTAADEEFETLTNEQFETFHAGLRADLNEEQVQEFFAEAERKQAALRPPPPPPLDEAGFLLRPSARGTGEYPEWGFAIFRTAGYGDDGLVKQVKERIQRHVDEQFDQTIPSPEAKSAREKFRLIWFEKEDLNGVTPQEIARRYTSVAVPFWARLSLCLCVDEESIKSIEHEDSGKAPPHVLAISSTCGQDFTGDEAEDEEWTGGFKVAVKSIVSGLYGPISRDGLTPYEFGVGVTPDLVWVSIGRFGRQKAWTDVLA